MRSPLHHTGSSLQCEALWLQSMSSVVSGSGSAGAPELSCPMTCRIILSSLTGMEPVSPALKDRFLTSGPPGKSLLFLPLMNCDRKSPCAVIKNNFKRYVEAPLKIIFRLESG